MQMIQDGVLRDMTPAEIAEWQAAQAVPAAVPQRITRRQGRLALLEAGLLDQVEAIMRNPDTPRAARITYEDATEWWRDAEIIEAMAKGLNLPPEQVDELFRVAAGM